MTEKTIHRPLIPQGKPYNPWMLSSGLFVHNWLARRPEVSPGAKLVFGRLCQFAGRNGLAWPSHCKLGTELGYSSRQARRLVTELESCGLIRRIGRTRENGSTKSNGYEFIGHQWMMEPDTEGMPESVNPAGNGPHLTTPGGSDVAMPPGRIKPPLKRIRLKRLRRERVSLRGIGKHPNGPVGA